MKINDLAVTLPMNLQFFAEATGDANGPSEATEATGSGPMKSAGASDRPQSMVSMTPQQFEERLSRASSSAAKVAVEKYQSAQTEAKKLAGMDQVEKIEYERDQLRAENNRLTAKQNRNELEKTAAAILTDKGLAATPALLDVVVRKDADETNTAISALVQAVDELVTAQVADKLRGKTPSQQPVSTKHGGNTASFGKQIADRTNRQGQAVATDFFAVKH
ncbi:DUF4355 domain-containing protein [Furfurilactobacillus sp. WILCCON 0119]